MGWIRIHAKFDSKCRYCRAAIKKGDRVAGLPPEKSSTGKWLVACAHCLKTKGLNGPEKTEKPAKAEKPAKPLTLSDIIGGVKSASFDDPFPDDALPDDALDRIMNEEFKEEELEPQKPSKKEIEKYSLAWFAAGAKWKLG